MQATSEVSGPDTVSNETADESIQNSAIEPETVVSSLVAAMQTNNGETIRSLFATHAAQAYGNGTPRTGAAFFAWLESDIISRQGRVENAQLSVNGNEVTVTGLYRSHGYSSDADFLFRVEDGRITSWQMRY